MNLVIFKPVVYDICFRVFVLDKVTDFLLLLGKLVVVGIVGSLSFVIFSGERERERVLSPLEVQLRWVNVNFYNPQVAWETSEGREI